MSMKKYYWDVLVRGYCHPKNSHKEMDADLVMAMAEELVKADEDCKKAEEVLKLMKAELKFSTLKKGF